MKPLGYAWPADLMLAFCSNSRAAEGCIAQLKRAWLANEKGRIAAPRSDPLLAWAR
jgi:hypothetical protein